MSLRGTGQTQVEALRGLAATLGAVRDGIAAVDGVAGLEVRSGQASVVQTFTVQCEQSRDRERTGLQGECAPTGFAASSTSRFRVRPAARAGDVLSVAAERGAVAARTEEVGLDDPGALRAAAVEAAVREARAQAEAMARATGVRLGPVLRVIDGNARLDLGDISEVDSVVVTGSRIRAAVTLAVEPPPVTQEARVSVVFAIAR